MVGFEEGYRFFVENSSTVVGAEMSNSYVSTVNEEIEKLANKLNELNGKGTSVDQLKGNVAEIWHAGTFNIKAAVKGSEHRAWALESNEFASVDIDTNFGDKYGLKYYATGEKSAKAQSITVRQRLNEYQAKGGKDSIDKFLKDRGYKDESVLNDPIYSGQMRLVPRDQLEESANWLKRQIAKESARRPDLVDGYQDTLDFLTDRLKDNEGVESIPLSEKESGALAALAKRGDITAEDLNLDPRDIIGMEDVMRQAVKAGMSAAMLSVILKAAPEIYKAVSYLIVNGEIDAEQFKEVGFAAMSGGAEGFVRGTISSAITTFCKTGKLGEALIAVDPMVIGTATVLTMNVIKNAYCVAVGKKTRRQLTEELIREMYVSTCSLIGGGISQAFIEIPVFGYLIGSFVGSIVGSFTYNVGQKAVVSFCVDSGFTMFGLVEQDYTLPKEVLNEMGLETFDYETFEAESFKPETFEFETFEADTFKPETLGITFLRRGVIGVSRVGYTM